MSQVYKFELTVEIEAQNLIRNRNQAQELEKIKRVNEKIVKYANAAACEAMGIDAAKAHIKNLHYCDYENMDIKIGNFTPKTSPTVHLVNSEIISENKKIINGITKASAIIYSEKGAQESLSKKIRKNEDLISVLNKELNM